MKRRFAETILASFRDGSVHEAAEAFATFSDREWRRGLRWLDSSGLALYFLAQLERSGLTHSLPEGVHVRLIRNQLENRVQCAELMREFVKINDSFRGLRLRYALLKGFSLFPDYCPDPALRCQFDLDVLIDRSAANSFANALRTLGYRAIHAGDSAWEFKSGTDRLPSIEDLYKPKPQKAVELHFAVGESQSMQAWSAAALSRVEERSLRNVNFPALSETDSFLFQSLHILRHVRSEWIRVSWLLEFHNFIRTHRNDESLWREIRTRGDESSECAIAIGTGTLLATKAFGEIAPPTLMEWTVRTLPPPVRLWIDKYGSSVLLADFPGTKLYLLLQHELLNTHEWRQLRRARLLPFHRVPAVTHQSGETQRHSSLTQARFTALRMRFHLIEGLRYLIESARWKRVRNIAFSNAMKPFASRVVEETIATRS